MRLWREKIKSTKVQLELNLVTAVEGNKKFFYKYISYKKGAKEKDKGRKRDEEKAEVLNAFLPQSLIERPVVLRIHNALSWKTEMGAEIQQEVISNLLHHSDTHKFIGPDGIHPRSLRELPEVLTELLSIIYQQC